MNSLATPGPWTLNNRDELVRRQVRPRVTHPLWIGQSNALGYTGASVTTDNGLRAAVPYAASQIDTAISFAWPSSAQPRRDVQPYAASPPDAGAELGYARAAIQLGVAASVLQQSKMAVAGVEIDTILLDANYSRMVTYARAQEAATGHLISDVHLWHGEADAVDDTRGGNYYARLTTLGGKLRTDFPGCRIWLMRLNAAATGAAITASGRALVRAAQAQFAADHPSYVWLIDLDDVLLGGDGVHYPQESYWTVGTRLAWTQARALGYLLPDERVSGCPSIRAVTNPCVSSGTIGASVKPHATPALIDELQLLAVCAGGILEVPTLSDAQGFVEIAGSPVVSLSSGVRCYTAVYWRYYKGQGNPTIAGGSQQRRCAKIVTINGAALDGAAIVAVTSNVNNAFVVGMSLPSVVTSLDRCLVIAFHGHHASGLNALTMDGGQEASLAIDSYGPANQKLSIIADAMPVHGTRAARTGSHAIITLQATIQVVIKAAA